MIDIARQLRSLAPRIALGTNAFGWTASADESAEVLDELLSRSTAPILLDTADVYTAPGADNEVLRTSEGVIGAWLSAHRGARERTLIASKVGGGSGSGLLSRDAIRRGAEGSLRRLNTDHLDVFYAHKDDPSIPLEETVSTFDALRREGLIRGVGLSTYTPARIREWMQIADRTGAHRPVALMQRYNLVSRRSFERDYLPILTEFSLAGFAYFVLASGLLTGKFCSQDEVAASARAKMTTLFTGDETFVFISTLRNIARELDRPPAAVATAWMLERDGVTAPVVGARTAQQLSQILDELAPLPSEASNALTEASAVFA